MRSLITVFPHKGFPVRFVSGKSWIEFKNQFL